MDNSFNLNEMVGNESNDFTEVNRMTQENGTNNTIALTSEQFDSFYSALNLVRDHFTDCDIRNGHIRQHVDSYGLIFEIMLEDLIGRVDMPLSYLKVKLDLFKMFTGSDVEFIESERRISISDSFSSFSFVKAVQDFMNVRYMDDETFTSRFNFSRCSLVVDTTFSEKITERMRIVPANIGCLVFAIKFSGETCKIYAVNENGDHKIDIATNIPLNVSLEDCECHIDVSQLIVDHDGELKLQLYHDPENDIILNKTSGVIKSVNFNIYGRTKFLEPDSDF